MTFKRFFRYVRLSIDLSVTSLLAAMEYRLTFLSQLTGMIFNDICWALLWIIFFERFPNLNGWRIQDTLVLFGVSAASFGFFMGFTGGVFELARKINRGDLDHYLSFPKHPLWHISFSVVNIAPIGDIIFGLIVAFAFIEHSLVNFLILLVAVLLGAVMLYSFCTITQSIGFFVDNFQTAAENFMWQTVGLCFYPQNAFEGVLKLLTCTVLPATLIFFWPADLAKSFSWSLLGLMTAATLLMFSLALFVFHAGLRRYESGNLMQTRI